MQERVKELGLITEEELRRRKSFAYILLLVGDILIPLVMIVFVNKAGTYFECVWQYYILFLGMEFYDWLFVDFSVPIAMIGGGICYLVALLL